jgi:SRSO17 transposase
VQVFRPLLTEPSYVNMLAVMVGWILTPGRHAITEALVATGLNGVRHHEAFHRFFSRARWCRDGLGRAVFRAILGTLVPDDQPLAVVIDDTLALKKGPKVFGIGTHIDPVRSTRAYRVFCFGHCWVVLAVAVRVPFSRRWWALPILFRLYRTKKTCAAKRQAYRTKTQLARELLHIMHGWVGERRVEISVDAGYCNATVLQRQPRTFVFFGRMRPDAVLTALPEKGAKRRGRPRRRGTRLPKPEQRARDGRRKWQQEAAELYGEQRRVTYQTFCAQWYRAAGIQLLRVVIVRCTTGSVPFQVFFSTDPNLTAIQVLQGVARRWSIECAFEDLKQYLGFGDSAARTRKAVERTAPFVGLIFSMLVLWFARGAAAQAQVPLRPWYSHKQDLSFADIVRTARFALLPFTEILVARCIAPKLQKISHRECSAPVTQAGDIVRSAA